MTTPDLPPRNCVRCGKAKLPLAPRARPAPHLLPPRLTQYPLAADRSSRRGRHRRWSDRGLPRGPRGDRRTSRRRDRGAAAPAPTPMAFKSDLVRPPEAPLPAVKPGSRYVIRETSRGECKLKAHRQRIGSTRTRITRGTQHGSRLPPANPQRSPRRPPSRRPADGRKPPTGRPSPTRSDAYSTYGEDGPSGHQTTICTATDGRPGGRREPECAALKTDLLVYQKAARYSDQAPPHLDGGPSRGALFPTPTRRSQAPGLLARRPLERALWSREHARGPSQNYAYDDALRRSNSFLSNLSGYFDDCRYVSDFRRIRHKTRARDLPSGGDICGMLVPRPLPMLPAVLSHPPAPSPTS